MLFQVEALEPEEAKCRVVVGGVLSNQKSMSFPGKVMHQAYLSEQDKADLLFGIQTQVDYIAASFVSCYTEKIVIPKEHRKLLQINGFCPTFSG